MPVSKAQVVEFVAAKADLATAQARFDAAAAAISANLAVGETVATVPSSPPVIRKTGEGTIAVEDHPYPES